MSGAAAVATPAAAPAAPAPTPAAPSSAAQKTVDASAKDSALVDKYVKAHAAEVAKDLGKPRTPTPRSHDGSPAKDQDASTDDQVDDPSHADEGSTEAGDKDDQGADDDAAERRRAPDSKKPDAAGGVAADVEAARAAWEKGDQGALDAALKKLLPGSKGLAEFTVDGRRWSELRTVAGKRKAAQDKRDAEQNEREQNLQKGMGVLETLVQRYQPIEQLVQAAAGDDVDAFVSLVERLTKKPIGETVKRHLDKKLGKAEDPHMSALERQLKEEREARQALEARIENERKQAETNHKIQRHLVFLNETLSGHADPAVRALVASPAGMRAIFEAQRDAYDERTNTTLTPEQAARHVIAQKRKEFEPWAPALGAAPAPAPRALPAPAPTPTPPARALNGRGGGASGPGRPLTDNELFEKYEHIHKVSNG